MRKQPSPQPPQCVAKPLAPAATPKGSESNSTGLLSGRILPCGSYTRVGEEMTWPSYEQGELEWQLRHGTEGQVIAARVKLASIVAAYRELIGLTQNRRNEICRAIREAR